MEEIENNVFNEYKRFLKDSNVFHRVMQIHKVRMNKMGIGKFMHYFNISPEKILSDSNMFTIWANTEEDKLFWWKISNRWKVKCLKENLAHLKYNKYDYQRVIETLIRFKQNYKEVLTKDECNFVSLSIEELNEIKNKLK